MVQNVDMGLRLKRSSRRVPSCSEDPAEVFNSKNKKLIIQ